MTDIEKKKIVIDLDNTLSITEHGDYENSKPVNSVVSTLRDYHNKGYEIVIYSSRNMRTYNGNLGKINVHTLPNIIKFLDNNDIPYDQIIMGKPWPGYDGFYVDDKCIRPSEFVNMSESEIHSLLEAETEFVKNGAKQVF